MKNAKISLTLLIPFHNSGKYIQENIHSISAQMIQHPEVHAVYINDASLDDSEKFLLPYRSERLTVVKVDFKNAYKARNFASISIQSEYMAFVDSDVVLSPRWLENALEAIHSQKFDLIAGPSLTNEKKSILLRIYNSYLSASMEARLRHWPMKYFSIFGGNMILKRSIFESVGRFPEIGRGSDTAFAKRYMRLYGTERIKFDPQMYVTHLEIKTGFGLVRKIATYLHGASSHSNVDKNSEIPITIQVRIMQAWIKKSKWNCIYVPVILVMLLSDRFLKMGLRALPKASRFR